MELQVAKWGKSLALRIPADVVRRLGLKEGSLVEAQLTLDGSLSIRPARWDRQSFGRELSAARAAMPQSEPVVEQLRRAERY